MSLHLLSGCGTPCSQGNGDAPSDFRGGESNGETYQTASFDGPHVPYPGGQSLRIVHQLDRRPEPGTIDIWVGFEQAGELTPAAGDQAVIRNIDGEAIIVSNTTCYDLFIYVYAEASDLLASEMDG